MAHSAACAACLQGFIKRQKAEIAAREKQEREAKQRQEEARQEALRKLDESRKQVRTCYGVKHPTDLQWLRPVMIVPSQRREPFDMLTCA